MLEIVLTREDANTELALLTEWLVENESEVAAGQPVCVVETTKATVEIEAPGAGTVVQLYEEGAEVELGRTVAYIAETADELASLATAKKSGAPPSPRRPAGERKVTRKAAALAELHGVDLALVEKRGFVTEKDVEEVIARQAAGAHPEPRSLLAGVSTSGVSLPASLELDDDVGVVDPALLEALRGDPDGFRGLTSDEKCAAYREAGAVVGEEVILGEGVLLDAARVVLGDRVWIGEAATVRCDDVLAVGAGTRFGSGLEIKCRRAFVGEGVHCGRSARFGGGGHRDPWATLAVGDLTFLGDEIFVNVCRPVLVGREVFLTMRAMIVTHNIGHSILEGFENRFAPVVLEDRSQVGLGAVVYAGCRVGSEAIVASSSYVVGDVPPGAFAIGVPAKVTGSARHELSRARRLEVASRMIDELHELLSLRGHEVSAIAEDDRRGFEVDGTRIFFVPRYRAGDDGPAVILALEVAAEPPDGVAVLDLVGRRVHGGGGAVLDSVREFCRKRGIRFEPGPWRYPGGLV